MSRRLFKDFKNHKLGTIARNFKIDVPIEHRAIADCKTTHLCYEYIKDYINNNKIDISVNTRARNKLKASDIKTSSLNFNEEHLIFNQNFVFTGVLEKMSRREAMQIVADFGGKCQDIITKDTNFLVLGNNDYCKSIKDGKSSKQKKAELLMLKGQDLQIIPENVFYDMIG